MPFFCYIFKDPWRALYALTKRLRFPIQGIGNPICRRFMFLGSLLNFRNAEKRRRSARAWEIPTAAKSLTSTAKILTGTRFPLSAEEILSRQRKSSRLPKIPHGAGKSRRRPRNPHEPEKSRRRSANPQLGNEILTAVEKSTWGGEVLTAVSKSPRGSWLVGREILTALGKSSRVLTAEFRFKKPLFVL